MRVILDTNILLSGIISSRGTPARLIEAWLDQRFVLVSHEDQLAELRDVSRRPKIRALATPAAIGRVVNQIARIAKMPVKLPSIERSRDPHDDFLLALCEAGEADWLVTGDKADLLVLDRHGRTRMATAAAFAATLRFSSR